MEGLFVSIVKEETIAESLLIQYFRQPINFRVIYCFRHEQKFSEIL